MRAVPRPSATVRSRRTSPRNEWFWWWRIQPVRLERGYQQHDCAQLGGGCRRRYRQFQWRVHRYRLNYCDQHGDGHGDQRARRRRSLHLWRFQPHRRRRRRYGYGVRRWCRSCRLGRASARSPARTAAEQWRDDFHSRVVTGQSGHQCRQLRQHQRTDTDQRGFPRPVGPACDIGPFEVQACTNLGSTITCISTNLVGSPIDPAGGRVFFDTPTFTSSCPGANVQTTPPSGGLFPIGTNAVPAVLLDASGTELTNCSFTVIIRGIDEELDDAIALVPGLGLSSKLEKVILRKLNAAKKTLLAGRRGQTCEPWKS